MPKAKKSIVVFTTFWDADYLIEKKYLIFKEKDSIYQANFFIDENNESSYTVNSIALSHPDFSKFKAISSMERLDFWCPTYNMLHDYHNDKDWGKYTERYKKLMRERKDRVVDWIESLKPNHIYVLCCWENTSKEASCHRKLIYDALKVSSRANKKIFSIYRDGSNKLDAETRLTKLETVNDQDNVFQTSFIPLLGTDNSYEEGNIPF